MSHAERAGAGVGQVCSRVIRPDQILKEQRVGSVGFSRKDCASRVSRGSIQGDVGCQRIKRACRIGDVDYLDGIVVACGYHGVRGGADGNNGDVNGTFKTGKAVLAVF